MIRVMYYFIYQVFGHCFTEGQAGAVVPAAFDVGQDGDEELGLQLLRPQDPSVGLAKVLKAIWNEINRLALATGTFYQSKPTLS